MSAATRARWRSLTSGPISDAGSVPSPTRNAAIRSRRRSISGSALEPTATATDTAMHRCPADP